MYYVVVILDGSGLNKENIPFVTVFTIINTFSYHILPEFFYDHGPLSRPDTPTYIKECVYKKNLDTGHQ